ncbi:MAG: chemotaxis protein CheW, partial [Noviherbaspirillum sp.]
MKPALAAGADWQSLHERLERVRREVERLTEPGPQWRQEILRERALALARGGGSGQAALAADAADSADSLETIEFKAGGERYAVETAHVAHVHPMLPITPLPGVPVFIAGIVAPQGEVLAVVDLRSLLNLPLSGLAEPVAIIVLQGAGREFGILAEEIVGIARYRGDAMAGGPQGMAGIDPAYLKGVTPGRCAILDARQLLS